MKGQVRNRITAKDKSAGPFSSVHAILFDLGGTLDAEGVDWATRFHKLFRAEGLRMSFPTFQKTSERVLAAFAARPEVHAWRLAPAIGHNVRAMSEPLGIRSPVAQRRIASRMVQDLMKNARASAPVLKKLRSRGYRLGLISNNVGNTVPVLRDEGLLHLFDTVLDSTIERVKKPDPEIFHRALRRLNLPAAHATYVGDTFENDVAGPKRVGMSAVWYQGPVKRPCPDRNLPDATIRKLADLLGHFPGPPARESKA